MAQPPRQPDRNSRQSDQSDLEDRIVNTFDEDDDDDVQFADDDDETIQTDDDDDDFRRNDDDVDDFDRETDDDDDPDDRRVSEPDDQRQRQDRREPENKRNEKFQFREDKAGNFVDEDGNIVVRAGKSRDIFVKIKKAWQAEQRKVVDITQEFNKIHAAGRDLHTKYVALQAQKTLAEQRGLTPEENQQAVDLAALNKIDPKQAVRKILTIAHGNGIDLSDLGVTGPLDAKTVAEQAVKDYIAQSKPVPKTPEEEAQEEADGFLKRWPDARQHVKLIVEAKDRYPSMSFDQIWFEILFHAKRPQKQSQKRDERGDPRHVIPRNNSRGSTGGVVNGKLSLKAVDPTKSVHDIGQELLKDIRAIEREG